MRRSCDCSYVWVFDLLGLFTFRVCSNLVNLHSEFRLTLLGRNGILHIGCLSVLTCVCLICLSVIWVVRLVVLVMRVLMSGVLLGRFVVMRLVVTRLLVSLVGVVVRILLCSCGGWATAMIMLLMGNVVLLSLVTLLVALRMGTLLSSAARRIVAPFECRIVTIELVRP